MIGDTTHRTPAGHLLFSITQAHHDILETMLRADVILTLSQRRWLWQALDALRKTHCSLVHDALGMPPLPQGAHA